MSGKVDKWTLDRQKGLLAWLWKRRERYGDSIAVLEADLIVALNACQETRLFGVPSGQPRIYDGSTWVDNPHVEPVPDPVILSFPSPQAAG